MNANGRMLETLTGFWFWLLPVLLLHLVTEVYQFICFPVYGIPKVRRQDYLVMDRF